MGQRKQLQHDEYPAQAPEGQSGPSQGAPIEPGAARPPVAPTGSEAAAPSASTPPASATSGGGSAKPPSRGGGGGDDGGDGEDEEERGMLRMSFLDHLSELRSRILRGIFGLVVAFCLCLLFAEQLWNIVAEPAIAALRQLHYQPQLVQITPMETFTVVWLKLPLLAAVFLGSPWILYQVWAFIAPGLYKRERRWAAPFVICSAGLFILGGLFAYFIAFRFALMFLLGLGRGINVAPMVSVNEYFDLFVNVTLGIGLVFELPVLIFFLTLLRITSPAFLLRHSRYAILAIAIIAAVVTPTPDAFNMMLFAVPMWLLFYVGIFAGYLLVLHRDKRRFPWGKVLPWAGLALLALAAVTYFLATKYYGYHAVPRWPFLTR
ncbi:MAG: twin-arginine translocase subunit TatC [Bryobacteraceae bacterium]